MAAVLRGIRGATTLDEDTAEQVFERTQALIEAIVERNSIQREDLVSMLFTVTEDISSAFPAAAARALGYDDVALIGATEASVVGAPPRCVRVLVHCYSSLERTALHHVYLEGAAGLRRDLTQ